MSHTLCGFFNGKIMHNFTQKVPGHFETDKYVFFWGGPFSNWHPCEYEYLGQKFNCSEQQFIATKATLFKDDEALKTIMGTDDPSVQKRAGRLVKNYDDQKWTQTRYLAMQLAVLGKFSQNIELQKILLRTKNKIICEASPYDKLWGIGIGVDHPDILDESKWQGENLLGKVLMDIREKLLDDLIECLQA